MSARAGASPNRDYAIGLARAFAGAIIFGLPLLMTMEMWWLGFHADPARLCLFLVVNFLVIVGLSRFGGFERTVSVSEDILDALAAYGIAIVASSVLLSLFAILTPDMPVSELVGKVAIQSIPASFGAMIARKQLAGGPGETMNEEEENRRRGYAAELFLMTAGALFLAFNVAPTEEMILIGFMMSPAHALGLVLFTLILLHAFVYALGFAGQEESSEGSGFGRRFVGYTLPGYGIALLVSVYVLWSFGRTDGADLEHVAAMTVVLGFPAAIGAAIARLVV
jgi:putative integral membrane protein (TIGR02587 family)